MQRTSYNQVVRQDVMVKAMVTKDFGFLFVLSLGRGYRGNLWRGSRCNRKDE